MPLGPQVYFEDVSIGQEIPALSKGPLNTPHLMRWSSATENWHRIHYDLPFAQGHDKLPGLVVNGSLKQNFVMQLLKDWAGAEGWVWRAKFQFRAMNIVGETLRVWGRVTGLRQGPDYGLADLDIGIVNREGQESTPGTATVALPFREGRPVPYPFTAPDLSQFKTVE